MAKALLAVINSCNRFSCNQFMQYFEKHLFSDLGAPANEHLDSKQ